MIFAPVFQALLIMKCSSEFNCQIQDPYRALEYTCRRLTTSFGHVIKLLQYLVHLVKHYLGLNLAQCSSLIPTFTVYRLKERPIGCIADVRTENVHFYYILTIQAHLFNYESVKNGKAQDDVIGVTDCNNEGVQLNSIINFKMSKKLRLSVIKYFKLHIGKT